MSKPLLKKTGKPLIKKGGKPLSKTKESKHLIKKASTAVASVTPPKVLTKKAPPPPPPPRTGPKPAVPKGWKWLGKKDPAFKKEGLVLVDPKNMPDTFPPLHPRMVPGTQWRVSPKGQRDAVLVTTMPDGVKVAWDTCLACTNQVTRCICKPGIVHPRSIEWIYVLAVMRKEGEEIHHPMDSTSPHVTMRGVFHYAGKSAPIDAPRKPFRRPEAPKSHPTPSKPATGRSARLSKPSKGKTLRKSSSKPVEQVDVTNVDLAELGKTAAAGVDRMLADFDKRIASDKKKPLLKKGKR